MSQMINFLRKNPNTRKIFGERELKIIEKQLLGINLTQSEKNRLSRDIRKKFDFIKEISKYNYDFELKKGSEIKELIVQVKKDILDDQLKSRIKRILLFGSSVKNERTFRSDIDIAVEFKDEISLREATEFRLRVLRNFNDKMDIQVFNILPEKIQNSILKNHKVLYQNG